MNLSHRLYDRLMTRQPDAENDLPDEVRAAVPANGLRIVSATALQSSGDQTINASTVLPWLLVTLGAPTALIGLLVPIRESGSMLPQLFLTPLILRFRRRAWVVIGGALIQAVAVAIIAATAVVARGLLAGLMVVAALALFAFGRSLSSVASKDVQGRTIPKGERGQINGLATTAAGLVAVTLGVLLRVTVGESMAAWQFAVVIGVGAILWLAVAFLYGGVREPVELESRTEPTGEQWLHQLVRVLREDKRFRDFVVVRSLLLVSALSPPFVVALSIQHGSGALAGLGGYIIASGLAALVGGRFFGRLADKSSKRLMSIGAGFASAIIVATVLLALLPETTDQAWIELCFIVAYFSLTLTHTGVRVGRKTYIVDMAEGDQRTLYVAVSNSALGLILLAMGGVTAAIATVGITWALLFLAALGVIGVIAGARLPEVSRR